MSMYVSASRRTSEEPSEQPAQQPVEDPVQQSVNETRSVRRFPVGPGWVVHLPVTAPDLAAAVSLAEEMAAWLACVPQIDAGAVEVSAEDEQSRRVRVLCQRRVSDEERCWLPRRHEGACYAGQRRSQRRVHNDVARRWASTVDI